MFLLKNSQAVLYSSAMLMVVWMQPPQDHLACGLSVCLTSRRSAIQIRVFQNLVYELTAGQVGTGYAWKLYTCCAAATLVSGTRAAPGLHPGTPTGVKVLVLMHQITKHSLPKNHQFAE